MPIYKYTCHKCKNEESKLLSMKERMAPQTCSICNSMMFQELPSGVESVVFEMKDPLRGKQIKKGIEGQLKARNKAHHDQYELAEKIDKHGLDEAKSQGWLRKLKKL
jgi:putative FmdB family regulatory protein